MLRSLNLQQKQKMCQMICAKAGTAGSWQNMVTALARHGDESQGSGHQRSSQWDGNAGQVQALQQSIAVWQQPEAGCQVQVDQAALAGLTTGQIYCPSTTMLVQWSPLGSHKKRTATC